jgi:hypothetical protein
MKSLIIICMVLYGIHYFSERQKRVELAEQEANVTEHSLQLTSNLNRPTAKATEPSQIVSNSSSFKCDGRTHCSQMHSCEEAKFFINNCPGTKMDGNNDGQPCEQQWCN